MLSPWQQLTAGKSNHKHQKHSHTHVRTHTHTERKEHFWTSRCDQKVWPMVKNVTLRQWCTAVFLKKNFNFTDSIYINVKCYPRVKKTSTCLPAGWFKVCWCLWARSSLALAAAVQHVRPLFLACMRYFLWQQQCCLISWIWAQVKMSIFVTALVMFAQHVTPLRLQRLVKKNVWGGERSENWC